MAVLRHGPPFPTSRASVPILVALAVTLVAGTSGCGLVDPERESFIIQVDSISAPETVAPGDTLVVTFHGLVGSDGCYRLDRVDRGRTPGRLELRFHGERRTGRDVVCTDAPVFLDHEERVIPPLEDPFTLAVRQPGGESLERVVRVE